MSLSPDLLQQAMWALAIDKVTADVVDVFESQGIDVMLVKGPVIGRWLYPGEVRGYGDSDLLISPADWDRAVSTLEELGFHNYLGPLDHPRMESQAGTGFIRGHENIDLHSTLHGLDADPAVVWQMLWTRAQSQDVGGRTVRVPDRPAILMHIALHAVHHVEGKPLEDLARAARIASLEEWQAAADLADQLDGMDAFATGIRLLSESKQLAARLSLPDAGSWRLDLRVAQVPVAEGLNDLMSAPRAEKLRIIWRELFPNRAFMRWWMPLARRGRVGLVASYPLRWLRLLLRLPAGCLAVYRVRLRRKSRS
ncbi:MAG TPA: nucleotidyltransferase family protein [Baekduia sp.]|nr:nucleotidyltransferase family protein [Baekduia sp.]